MGAIGALGDEICGDNCSRRKIIIQEVSFGCDLYKDKRIQRKAKIILTITSSPRLYTIEGFGGGVGGVCGFGGGHQKEEVAR